MNYFQSDVPPEVRFSRLSKLAHLTDAYLCPSSFGVKTTFMGLSLLNTTLVLAAIILVGALAALGRSTLMGMSGERIIARLRKEAYESVMHQEIQYTDTKAGNIVSRLSFVPPPSLPSSSPHPPLRPCSSVLTLGGVRSLA